MVKAIKRRDEALGIVSLSFWHGNNPMSSRKNILMVWMMRIVKCSFGSECILFFGYAAAALQALHSRKWGQRMFFEAASGGEQGVCARFGPAAPPFLIAEKWPAPLRRRRLALLERRSFLIETTFSDTGIFRLMEAARDKDTGLPCIMLRPFTGTGARPHPQPGSAWRPRCPGK